MARELQRPACLSPTIAEATDTRIKLAYLGAVDENALFAQQTLYPLSYLLSSRFNSYMRGTRAMLKGLTSVYYFYTSVVLSNREHFYYMIVYPTSSISLDDTVAVLIRHTRKSTSETEIHKQGGMAGIHNPVFLMVDMLVSLPIFLVTSYHESLPPWQQTREMYGLSSMKPRRGFRPGKTLDARPIKAQNSSCQLLFLSQFINPI